MISQTLTLWIGVALCLLAILQLALWSSQSFFISSQNKKQFELSRELLKQQIREKTSSNNQVEELQHGTWNGFRPFKVAKLVKETSTCTSVYIQPEDGKPICSFRPGQHLTFKFIIPGEAKPVVRCYSLSAAPNSDFYRISVKAMLPPRDKPELPPGRASNFVNDGLTEGERIEVKAPSGHFFLDESSKLPVVLLAGGVGITPMVSIAEHLIATKSERKITLVYGICNSGDHQFKAHLEKLARENQNFEVFNCYSRPIETDKKGVDYAVSGFASPDVLKAVLESNQCQFYMCGPPPFMDSLYAGLMEWGVPESSVNFEAFGPATIKTKKKQASQTSENANSNDTIKFASSDVKVKWNSECTSLLELAEENDVMIDSGCRSGNCGTCATDILSGKVIYDDPAQIDCEPGKCLVCIAKPNGDVELDA